MKAFAMLTVSALSLTTLAAPTTQATNSTDATPRNMTVRDVPIPLVADTAICNEWYKQVRCCKDGGSTV